MPKLLYTWYFEKFTASVTSSGHSALRHEVSRICTIEFTLEHKRLSCPARIHFFANRIVNNWNSLPNHVVNAGSLNIFKNSLDRLWAKQDLLYNYRGVIDKKLYDI